MDYPAAAAPDRVPSWSTLVFRGTIAVVFGLIALARPRMSMNFLAVLFAVYAITDGLSAVGAGRHAREMGARAWPLYVEGAVSIAAGVLAFVRPHVVALGLVFLIGIRALVNGVGELAVAREFAGRNASRGFVQLGAMLMILFGLLILARPDVGGLALLVMVGVYAVLAGGMLIAAGFSLRRPSLAGHHVHA
jgi:uncharacterized membrane protein HdeD (DUF308 family)